ncbi:MAG: hypothetical protein GYA66_05295 [Phyllobacteriaceae bacterium]|jgi:uncharacterized tellurite resistance protein B-like protein|nr:hypothetical protein [Phyllobacteriaceae bacterium]
MILPIEGQTDHSKATSYLDEIVTLLSEPSGFARLTTEQRKFVLAVVMGSMVPADGKIRPCELEKLEILLQGRMQTRGETLRQALTLAKTKLQSDGAIALAATRLADLLGIEDRCALIGMLWDIALCDYELHAHEENLIYTIADKAGVPRKRVAEQQARSAANVT